MSHIPRISSPLAKPTLCDLEIRPLSHSSSEEETRAGVSFKPIPSNVATWFSAATTELRGEVRTECIAPGTGERTDFQAFQPLMKTVDSKQPGQKDAILYHFRPFRQEARLEPKTAPEDCPIYEEMTLIRQEAAIRARRAVLRREAAQKLQKWWRRVLYFDKFPPFSHFTTLRNAILRAAMREIATQLSGILKKAALVSLKCNKQVWNSYLHTCAAVIQRKWRHFRHNKQQKSQNRFKKLLLAVLQGWKTRKILQSWMLTSVKIRLKGCKLDEKPLFVLELIQTFRDEYRCGKWMRPRKGPGKQAIPLLSSPSSTSASTHTRHFSCLTETSSVSSPSKSPASPLIHPRSPPKPFLRRKTRTISGQKVSWMQVKTRVNCWGEGKKRPTASISPIYPRNSLEEFLAMEKITLQGENPLPSKRNLSKSQTLPLLHREKSEKNAVKVHEKAQIPEKLGNRTTWSPSTQGKPLIRLKFEGTVSNLL